MSPVAQAGLFMWDTSAFFFVRGNVHLIKKNWFCDSMPNKMRRPRVLIKWVDNIWYTKNNNRCDQRWQVHVDCLLDYGRQFLNFGLTFVVEFRIIVVFLNQHHQSGSSNANRAWNVSAEWHIDVRDVFFFAHCWQMAHDLDWSYVTCKNNQATFTWKQKRLSWITEL